MRTYLCAQVKWIIEMKFKQLVGVVLEPEGVRWRAQWGTCTESCAFLPHGRINFLSMGPSINPYILVKLGPCPCVTTESYYDWILKHETRYINTRSHSILQIKGQVFYPKTWYTTGFTNIKFCYPSECICLKNETTTSSPWFRTYYLRMLMNLSKWNIYARRLDKGLLFRWQGE